VGRIFTTKIVNKEFKSNRLHQQNIALSKYQIYVFYFNMGKDFYWLKKYLKILILGGSSDKQNEQTKLHNHRIQFNRRRRVPSVKTRTNCLKDTLCTCAAKC